MALNKAEGLSKVAPGKHLVAAGMLQSENNMKHKLKNSIKENMHGLLECMFVDYANRLRSSYPNRRIRNAAVFTSGVPEFARRGYIELIDARTRIPDSLT